MADFDIVYYRGLQQAEQAIATTLLNAEVADYSETNIIEECSSFLDAWDYCYAVSIGLAGIFISTNEAFSHYLDQIHKAASGAGGEYDVFQAFIGKALHHEGDHIDAIEFPFKNREGGNAYCIFHRLLWGHDVLSNKGDNPFTLMFQQKGLSGILQAVRHLLADTASKQGLPLPGSSYLDVIDENNKTTNYLIQIAQELSVETTGLKSSAQEIYSHMMTIRAQDVTASVVVKSMTEMYFKLRRIENDIRCAEIRLIAYTVNFMGEAIVGCVRQNGVPYINITLAAAMATSFVRLYHLNNKEIRQLARKTALQHDMVLELEDQHDQLDRLLPTFATSAEIISTHEVAESNFEDLLAFLQEDNA